MKILYPDKQARLELLSWPWELDQLVVAVLAATSRATLAEAWRHYKAHRDRLTVPEPAIRLALPETTDLLQQCDRVQVIDRKTGQLSAEALAHVYLGCPDRSLGEILFPDDSRPRINNSLQNTRVVMMGIALGCSDRIPTRFLSKIVAEPATVVKQVLGDPLKLKEYGRARSVLMAREDGMTSWNSEDPTLHRLLWGPEPGNAPLGSWRPRPWEIPAVGLTVALAARLYDSARDKHSTQGWDPKQGPLTWGLRDEYDLLTAGRRLQFGEEIAKPDVKLSEPKAIGSDSWEAPPHPAYFLPFVAGVKTSRVNSKGFAMYCDVLLLLTALDGCEDYSASARSHEPETCISKIAGLGDLVIHLPKRYGSVSRR